jgi:hypothetical protein
MSLKVIREGEDRYSLWSTRADGLLLEDVPERRLHEWADHAPDGSTVPDVEELVAAADERARTNTGARSYVEAREWLSGE